MCEEGLKKRYRSISTEDRLPVGVLEPDHTELSSSHDEVRDPFPVIKDCNHVDEYQDNGNFDVPQFFDPILIPAEESLPSAIDLSDTVFIKKSNDAIIRARQE